MKKEIRRLLKPCGKFIKIFMDWSLDDEIAAKSVELVNKYNKSWNSDELALMDVFDELFEGGKTEAFYCSIPFTRESWHGRMCACRGTLASMNREQFEKWSSEHLKMLKNYPETFTVKHKVYITCFEL